MNSDCELIRDLLPLYLDQAASDSTKKAVEEHLGSCEDCRRFSSELKKTAATRFKRPEMATDSAGYATVAKRLRKTKWYWRVCIGVLLGCVIFFSAMAAEGNRFDPSRAAYASNAIHPQSRLLATVPMGKERILYLYDDDGVYQNVDVAYQFPFWKYQYVWPNKAIMDRQAGLQLIANRSYGNSIGKSLYIVCAVAVNDNRVAYLELGKDGMMQRQNAEKEVAVFLWDETGKWDGTDSWPGLIKDTELQGAAYAKDGTAIYRLQLVSNPDGQDSFQWISAGE